MILLIIATWERSLINQLVPSPSSLMATTTEAIINRPRSTYGDTMDHQYVHLPPIGQQSNDHHWTLPSTCGWCSLPYDYQTKREKLYFILFFEIYFSICCWLLSINWSSPILPSLLCLNLRRMLSYCRRIIEHWWILSLSLISQCNLNRKLSLNVCWTYI